MTRSSEHAAGLLAATITAVVATSAVLPSDSLRMSVQRYVSASSVHALILIGFLGIVVAFAWEECDKAGVGHGCPVIATGFGAAAACILSLVHSYFPHGA